MINKEILISALSAIVWYNDMLQTLLELKNIILKTNEKTVKRPAHGYFKDAQFEVFWMMFVLIFGNYGTSPRSGWLEMKYRKEIVEFIDTITEESIKGEEI